MITVRIVKFFTIVYLFILNYNMISAQTNNILLHLLSDNTHVLAPVMDNPEYFEVQIIYTRIERDSSNQPHFETFKYKVNPEFYFYPASSVKFPATLLALEKLNRLGIKHLDKSTHLKIDSAYSGQSKMVQDPTSEDNYPSIGHFIKKIFLVSDNDAFNRIYEFLGQEELNQNLWDKGYKNVLLSHRLSVFLSEKENQFTNPFTFFNGKEILYEQPAKKSSLCRSLKKENLIKGKAYYSGGKLIKEPKDFSGSNNISLETLHDILIAVIFPESVPEQKRFALTGSDYDFLYKYMSMFPCESRYPKYDSTKYWDSYVKYLMFGDTKEPVPKNLRIFNKVGQAYGFMTDVAYVADFANRVEFFLSAVIYTNENLIFNDDNYEYDKIGLPFLASLGKIIYDYEIKRERRFSPDLSKFIFGYTD